MPRKPSFYIHKNWFVTESGGKGIHRLCPVEDGELKATKLLARWVGECQASKAAQLAEADSPYTIAQMAAEFLEYKTVTKRPQTVQFYQKNLVRLVDWFGFVQLAKLRFADGVTYIGRLQQLSLANATINHHIRSAKAVLNHAVDVDQLIKNPWRKLDELPEHQRSRLVTDDEFAKLLAACDSCIAYRGKISGGDNRQSMQDILRILRFTGMRPGEIRKLRKEHLFLERSLIILPADLHKTGTTAKHPEDRIIPLMEEAVEILLRRSADKKDGEAIFVNCAGVEWTEQLLSQRFGRLRKRAGLDEPDHTGERISLYNLRHSRLSEIGTKENWNFFNLMKAAGHVNPATTKRYVHPSSEDLVRETKDGEVKRKEKQ